MKLADSLARHPLPTLWRIAALLALGALSSASFAQGIQLPPFDTHRLANGATLHLMVKNDVPLVALDVTLRGGSLADPEGKEGTASLLAALMSKGAGARDAAAYAEAIDAVGGRIDFASGREATGLSAQFMAQHADLMIELAADGLRRPTLSEAEFDKVRARAIQQIQASKDSGPDQLIAQYGYAWLFRDHPYGRPSQGTEASLARIERSDVLAFQQHNLGGDRLIISVVGDFDPAKMRHLIESAFGDWPAARDALPTVAAKPHEQGRRVLLVDKPGATQTYFWMGNVGASATDSNRDAQDLVRTLFGGRFTSMLNSELRVKSGLTYGARAAIDRFSQPGAAAMYSFTRTESTAQAIDLMLEVLDRLHAGAIDQAALDSGRNYRIGQFAPQIETAAQIAGALGELSLHGLGREEIDGFARRLQAVDLDAARAATGVFAKSADLAIVLIGDAKTIREQAARYGAVTEHSLQAETLLP
ncbi:MAG: insulinase family protein [Xanthomonadales bacterium]|nr:insulinase family protein [Xanthomonadales bacterium]